MYGYVTNTAAKRNQSQRAGHTIRAHHRGSLTAGSSLNEGRTFGSLWWHTWRMLENTERKPALQRQDQWLPHINNCIESDVQSISKKRKEEPYEKKTPPFLGVERAEYLTTTPRSHVFSVL